MNTLNRTFIVLAIACGAAWLAKMAAIAANGPAESALIGTLWGIGMVTFLLASGTGVALLLVRAPVWARVMAGVVAVPVAFVLLEVLDLAIKGVYVSDGWFRDEVALVVAGILMAAIGVRLLRSHTDREHA